jgi:hypothetical protein
LIFRRGRRCICYGRTYPLGLTNIPFDRRRTQSSGPPSGSGALSAIYSDGTHGIQAALSSCRPFAGFIPTRVRRVSALAGLHAVCLALAAIYFRRGTDRPVEIPLGEINASKGTGDHERLVRLPGLPPVIDPSGGPSRQPFDPAMGFASCRIFGSSIGTSRAGSTPRRSSASGPARLQESLRTISAHGFARTSIDAEMKLRSVRDFLSRGGQRSHPYRKPPIPTAYSRG